jgi:hypothetical protein
LLYFVLPGTAAPLLFYASSEIVPTNFVLQSIHIIAFSYCHPG